jgi:hypothetical protein
LLLWFESKHFTSAAQREKRVLLKVSCVKAFASSGSITPPFWHLVAPEPPFYARPTESGVDLLRRGRYHLLASKSRVPMDLQNGHHDKT